MASFEDRMRKAQRRGSAIEIQKNPLDTAEIGKALKVENLGLAQHIDAEKYGDILKRITTESETFNNQGILDILEAEKQPYLFQSTQLVQMVNVTASVKTRLAMILMIAPRLVDPRAQYDTLVGLFRFSEEKAQIEEALKLRIQSLNNSIFKKESSSVFGGRGGRGRGGLTSGKSMYMGGRGDARRPTSLPINFRPEDISELEAMDKQRVSDADNDEEEDVIVQKTVMFGLWDKAEAEQPAAVAEEASSTA